MNKTFVCMKSDNVSLCAFRSDDEAIEKYLEWLNDADNAFYIGRNTSALTWIEEENFVKARNHELYFNICIPNKENPNELEMIGTCDIRTNPNDRNALLGILIGNKDYQNMGYGTTVMKMLVKYCFEELGKHNVALQVNSTNERAIACYKKVGFVECGREREVNFHKGKWSDCITMQILEQDYFDGGDFNV